MCRGSNNYYIERAEVISTFIEQSPTAVFLLFELTNISRNYKVTIFRQIFGNYLHARLADEPLRRHVTVTHLAFLQFDYPAIPGSHDSIGLPGRNNIPEQRIINREELRTMIELEFTRPETSHPTAGENTFFKYLDFGYESFKRGSAGKAGKAGADNGY